MSLGEGNMVDEPIQRMTSSIALPEMALEDVVEVKVVHPELGEMDSIGNDVRALIPAEERNVLWEALKYFCPEASMEEILVRPYEHKSKRLQESAAFELHVAWLLALCGLSPIVLGEYEHLVAKNTKVQRTSADILAGAVDRKWLAVVGCTLRTPKEEDFSNLIHVCEILRREALAGVAATIRPVIFTGAVGYGTCKELDGFGAMPVVDADAMVRLLKQVRAGQERRLLEFVDNPLQSL